MTSSVSPNGNVKPLGRKKVREGRGPELGLPEQHPGSKYCSRRIQDKILGHTTSEGRRNNNFWDGCTTDTER